MRSSTVERIIKDDRYFIEDNLFLPEVIDELRDFALTTDVKDDSYDGYYSINYSKGAFPLALLEDIVVSLKLKYAFLGEFTRGWAFVHDNNANGVTPHADPAKYNVNLWVTPNNSVDDRESNGLILYDVKPPPSWSWEDYNNDIIMIRKYLDYTKSKKTIIPYACNRLLIFNSKYFHETNKVSMIEGSENRRVNYTFMFE